MTQQHTALIALLLVLAQQLRQLIAAAVVPASKPGPRVAIAAGDRILTPWLTVMHSRLDGMPLVEVQLRRAGDELKGVKARVSSSASTH
jgi:hypothetical protein